MRVRVAAPLVIPVLSLLMVETVRADHGTWHYTVMPYAMFPNMRGDTGIRELPTVPVDQDPGDIFDKLQMGAMLFLEARNDQWAFSSDVLYMDLGSDIEAGGQLLQIDGDVDLSQIGWELAAMRRVNDYFEVGLAVTFNQIDVDVDFTVTTPLGSTDHAGGLEENWIDPAIVARVTAPINDKWFFTARGNIGGFGVGSDLAWQLQADVGYRPSDSWYFAFGYRIIDFDYDDGSGADRFVYDMQLFGPVLKLGFTF